MKRILLIFLLLLISCNVICAFSSVDQIDSTINPKSYYKVYEINQTGSSGNHSVVNILPLSDLNYDSKEYKYKYEDKRLFHPKSYDIPSYCLPEHNFIDTDNPFCSQYRPYGSNMYISF